MSNLLTRIKVYDVECYPNLFMVTFYSYLKDKMYTFSIYPESNVDERGMLFLAFTRENYIWCGFNNLFYDDAMLNYLIENPECSVTDLHNFSNMLIGGARNPYRYKSVFRSIDLLEILRAGYNVKSLKGVAVNLKYPRIQDLPIAPDEHIKPEQIEDLRSYNINDVVITRTILEEVLPLIEMRSFLTEHYNGELDLLTESNSGICKKLLTTFYDKKLTEFGVPRNNPRRNFRKMKTIRGDIAIKDIVYPRIKFETKQLQEFYAEILTHTIVKKKSTETSDNYEWKYKLDFAGNTYSLGLGGIHTYDKPAIYRADDEWCTLDVDCASMYPMSFIYNKLCPEHLDKEAFLSILNDLLDKRLMYKKMYKDTKDKSFDNLQGAMKIALNTFFGLTNSKTFWLFDPKATFMCTINNQLLMLMLIELFTLNGYQVISANTDGITIRCKHIKLENVRELYRGWEKMSGFVLEETFYNLYLRRDINNYLAITTDNKTKYKGAFTPQTERDLLQGFEYPIVTKALVDYFLHNVPIEKTVKEGSDIYDYCYSQKCGKQFTNHLRKVKRKQKLRYGKDLNNFYTTPKVEEEILHEEPIQNTLRFFVSLPETFTSDEEDLLDGYADKYHVGYSVVKKKMRETTRYDVVKDEQVKKCWWIVDLKTGEKAVDTSFSTKKSTVDILKEMNAAKDAVIEVEQVGEYVAGKFITLFNDYFSVEDFTDYKIDYDFYIDLVQKEVDKIEVKNNG